MYRKVIRASMFLMIMNLMSSPVFAQEQTQQVDVIEVIAVLYTSPTCQTCDTTYEEIEAITEGTIYSVDLRDVSISPKLEEEYNEATSICGIGKGVYPMLITQKDCYTDKEAILGAVEKAVNDATFFAQREELEDEPESEDSVQLSQYLEKDNARQEMDPMILLGMFVIPGVFIWGANYLIKNYKL